MEKENSTPTGPNFNQLELDVLKRWDEDGTFEKSLTQTSGGKPYVFYDGPPFATGLPHYGHILVSTIKDAFPRYHTMRGEHVARRWGWDCHGLPIENIVEQKLKISGKKDIEAYGVEQFNAACRGEVLRFAAEWGKTVHRMGRWVDFDSAYKTMDTSHMESVWWALRQLWDKTLVYEDRKVLLYCARCETPISNFEVAMDNSYRDVVDESVFVKFRVSPRQRMGNELAGTNTYFLAWTTTPWTLPGNTSLNIGPDIEYSLVSQGEERYILATLRLSALEGAYEVVRTFTARDLDGFEYEPLYPGVIPTESGTAHRVYLADFVTTEDGTGVVHNAAMYGEDDYQLAKAKNLPRVDMLDSRGEFVGTAVPEHLRGVFFKDASGLVIEDLREHGQLYRMEPYRHSYPHCYRCATPLYYSALPAWFINIQKLKPQLLAKNEDVTWHPGHLKHGRFAKSMEQAPDWNISRNRYWATPLPFWKSTQASSREVICVGSVDELRSLSTNWSDVYPNTPASGPLTKEQLEALDLHRPYIDRLVLKSAASGDTLVRVPEVVDCWVESGSMPFAELHYPFENREAFEGGRFPADFVTEYIAQTRAWFYVMHVVSVGIFDKAPFKNVLTTGTVLAEDGSKMSKSKGNYPDPSAVMEKYGVDAVRFYLLQSPVLAADDLSFSERGVQEVQRKVSSLVVNVLSFYGMYAAESPLPSEFPTPTNVLDRWLMSRLGQLTTEVTERLDGYDTVRACRAIVAFIDDLSTWYLRRSRDRMKASGADSLAAVSTLRAGLAGLSKVLAPFMPMLADHVYKGIGGSGSVHLCTWPSAPAVDADILAQMPLVRELASLGLAARKDAAVPVRQPLARLSYRAVSGGPVLSPELEQILLEELNVKRVDQSFTAAATAVVPGTATVSQFALDFELTADLRAEGSARELERSVQDMRKKAGLKQGEKINLYFTATDAEATRIITDLLDRNKLSVAEISQNIEVEADHELQTEVAGHPVWLGITKA